MERIKKIIKVLEEIEKTRKPGSIAFIENKLFFGYYVFYLNVKSVEVFSSEDLKKHFNELNYFFVLIEKANKIKISYEEYFDCRLVVIQNKNLKGGW